MAVIVEEVGVRIQVLDGHFSHSFVVKLFELKRPKINEKEAENGQFKKLFNLGVQFEQASSADVRKELTMRKKKFYQ